MNLNISTKTTHYVDAFDLERYIKELYGFTYEIVAAEEVGNDTSLTFSVTANFDSNDAVIFKEMQQGAWHNFKTHLLLCKLATDGFIPTGNYVIEVSW